MRAYRIYYGPSTRPSHLVTVTRNGQAIVDGSIEDRTEVARWLRAIRADSRYEVSRTM